MSTLILIALAAVAAPPQSYLLDINIARVTNGQLPVEQHILLDEAASLQVAWLAYAAKRNIATGYHQCQTAWLLDQHPELHWDRLLATYGGSLPEWLGAFDLARLCGFNAMAVDIGALGGRHMDAVAGWLGSPGHRYWLLYPDWRYVGIGQAGLGGGNFATWATFGNEQ